MAETTVVVGVEGTESSRDALIWAAELAVSRRAELELVCATGRPHAGGDGAGDEVTTQAAKALLVAESERALHAAPGLTVRTTLSSSRPAEALTEASAHAGVVVVGSHLQGLLERTLARSLSYQIVSGSSCPAVVVPAGTSGLGSGVVVGTDGSPDSGAGVLVAAAVAARRGEVLTVVHAWQTPLRFLPVDMLPESDDQWIEKGQRAVLADAVAAIGDDYPGLVVHQELVHQSPGRALLAAATGARLLVVGSRGMNGITRMLLGSVSHAMVLESPCPVMVVRV